MSDTRLEVQVTVRVRALGGSSQREEFVRVEQTRSCWRDEGAIDAAAQELMVSTMTEVGRQTAEVFGDEAEEQPPPPPSTDPRNGAGNN